MEQQPVEGHEGGSPVDSDQHEKDLLELLQILESATPVIPDTLMDYYMAKAGVECDDIRIKRLVALIGQKFITDVANDAMHFHRLRSAGRATGKKNTLTLEDLAAALAEYGINIKRPAYYT